jgi:hypothetical protein
MLELRPALWYQMFNFITEVPPGAAQARQPSSRKPMRNLDPLRPLNPHLEVLKPPPGQDSARDLQPAKHLPQNMEVRYQMRL